MSSNWKSINKSGESLFGLPPGYSDGWKIYLGKYYPEIILALYLLFVSLNILNHEMWRDEWQSWLIAQKSSSISNLFSNIRYESHPVLWYLCLYCLNAFSPRPVIMQVFHLMLSGGAIYIFLKYSPFTKLQKVLFVFGYYPLYEYSTMSRDYVIGILFLFVFCAIFPKREKNYLILFCLLFMLTQANVYSLIISIVCGAIIVYEIFTRNNLAKIMKTRKMEIFGGLCIFAIGIFSSIYQIYPPGDSGFFGDGAGFVGGATGGNFEIGRIVRTTCTLWRSYVAIPEFKLEFHESNILRAENMQAYLSFCLLSVSAFLLYKKPFAFSLYVFGTLGLLMFGYMKYFGYLRQHGHLFMIFIASAWISNHCPTKEFKSRLVSNIFLGKFRNIFIVVILCCQVGAGAFASAMDWIYPYSASKEAAQFIIDRGMDNILIMGHLDYAASAVSGYLNREIYYPASNKCGSFIVWNNKRKGWIRDEEIFEKAEELISKGKCDLLIITNYKLNDPKKQSMLIREFNRSIQPDERYYLYHMHYYFR